MEPRWEISVGNSENNTSKKVYVFGRYALFVGDNTVKIDNLEIKFSEKVETITCEIAGEVDCNGTQIRKKDR